MKCDDVLRLARQNAYRTAIKRRALSAPMRYLQGQHLLRGRVLDYGCGRGDDADTLGVERYDPHWSPKMPEGEFTTITCNYVLNVIASPLERGRVLKDIWNRLTDKGTAYIAVRDDVPDDGGLTIRGTWQQRVRLPLPVLRERKGSWVIYKLRRRDVRYIEVGDVA